MPYRQWRRYHRWSRAEHGEYDTRKPTAQERRAQKLFTLFQMTYPGAPMIYYGDEAGMWGANDPDCRKPMVWPDLQYAAERVHADGTLRSVEDAVEFDRGLFDFYCRTIRLRRRLPVLSLGDFTALHIDDDQGIYAFERRLGRDWVIVVLNNSEQSRKVELELQGPGTARNQRDIQVLRDLLDPHYRAAPRDSRVVVDLTPQWARLLAPGIEENTSSGI